MTQLLALGTEPWGARGRTRRLLGVPRGYRLIYVEPGKAPGRPGAYMQTEAGEQISLVSPSGKATPWDFGGLTAPLLLRRQTSVLQRLLAESGIRADTLWCESPVRAEWLKRIPHSKLIYDLRGQEGVSQAARDMAVRANAVIVSRVADAEALRDSAAKLCYLPDGTDFSLFSQSGDPLMPFPSDLFHIREPILGHIGTPGARAEMAYAEAAAKAFPQWNIVFLGDAPYPPKYPNIHFLGEKSESQLPAYLGHFNLCFRVEGSDAAEDPPDSVFACFAAGKPLVTTLYPKRMLDFTEAVYLAHSPESFVDGCRRALGERDAWRKKERIAFARASSWDARAAILDAFLRERDIL